MVQKSQTITWDGAYLPCKSLDFNYLSLKWWVDPGFLPNINSTNLVFCNSKPPSLGPKRAPVIHRSRIRLGGMAWLVCHVYGLGSLQGEHGTHEKWMFGCFLFILLDQYIHWVFGFSWIKVLLDFCSIFLFSWICPLIGFGAKIFSKSCNQSSLQLLVLVVLQHCNTWNVLKRCLPRLIYLCMRPSRRKKMTMMMIMMMILSSRS